MTGEVVITLCGAGAADTAGNDPELPVLPNQSTQEVRFRRRWCRGSDPGAFR
jgi:uncharacterized protein (DUF849 family)